MTSSKAVRALRALLLIFMAACANGDARDARSGLSCDARLLLSTSDGLQAGDPIVFNGENVGRITGLRPFVNQVEACAEFEKKFRPPDASIFLLERGERGSRFIRILEGSRSDETFRAGVPVVVQLPPETLEDRMWVTEGNPRGTRPEAGSGMTR